MDISATIPEITSIQKDWVFENKFKKYYYATKKKCECLECGNITKDIKTTCPKCKSKLISLSGRKRNDYVRAYYNIIEVYDEFQLVRSFEVIKFSKSGFGKPRKFCSEIVRHFIDESNKHTVVSCGRNFWGYSDHWYTINPLEIKNNPNGRYSVYGFVYPKIKVLPIIKRNGFRTGFHQFHPVYLISKLITDNKFETLFKTKRFDFINIYHKHEYAINKHWNTIKLCIRNNYKIKEPTIWFDLLDVQTYFKRDLTNPKYFFPEDIRKEHDRLFEKKRNIERKREQRERLKRRVSDAAKYIKTHSKFFDLEIKSEKFNIVVLKDLDEFEKEGKELNHCVYTNAYYRKENSLILSARKNDKPIETIEFSLEDLTIVQSYGKDNKETRLHKDIIRVVNRNKSLIRKRYEKKDV